MKYKHIVFDIDGTLIDTEYAVLHSLQETIRALSGREIPCSEHGRKTGNNNAAERRVEKIHAPFKMPSVVLE